MCAGPRSRKDRRELVTLEDEVKPHKMRYYLEQRDPDFAEKMAEVLCVYRQVKILKEAARRLFRPSHSLLGNVEAADAEVAKRLENLWIRQVCG
jgi:hypothetical protein